MTNEILLGWTGVVPMNEEETAALHLALAPICASAGDLIRAAVVMRITVEIEIALSDGAEDEDMPEIIEREILIASDLIRKFTVDMSSIAAARRRGMIE